MGYKNGRDVLPKHLLEEIQNYIQGELIYIPKMENTRSGWGENNGTRMELNKRNEEIYRLYKDGASVDELVEIFILSEDSIRKILTGLNKENIRAQKCRHLLMVK